MYPCQPPTKSQSQVRQIPTSSPWLGSEWHWSPSGSTLHWEQGHHITDGEGLAEGGGTGSAWRTSLESDASYGGAGIRGPRTGSGASRVAQAGCTVPVPDEGNRDLRAHLPFLKGLALWCRLLGPVWTRHGSPLPGPLHLFLRLLQFQLCTRQLLRRREGHPLAGGCLSRGTMRRAQFHTRSTRSCCEATCA